MNNTNDTGAPKPTPEPQRSPRSASQEVFGLPGWLVGTGAVLTAIATVAYLMALILGVVSFSDGL